MFRSLDKKRVSESTVSVKRALPKGVKLLGSIMSLSGTIVNGIPSGCERCALFREVSAFSISSQLSILHYWSNGSVEGILFHGSVASSGILMNLIPLDLFCLVWCLMDRCIDISSAGLR